MSNRLVTEEYEDRAFLMKGGAVLDMISRYAGANDMISVRLVSAEMDTKPRARLACPLPTN